MSRYHQLRVQLSINAAPDRVWAALVDVEQIKKWWGAAQGRIELRQRGLWALAWKGERQGFGHVLSGLVRWLRPKQRLRVEPLVYFNPAQPAPQLMRMSLSITRAAGRTRVAVRQEPLGEALDWGSYSREAARAWKAALENLKRFLED
ncbi:MAG TPA: SRPBCC domain-containing protein [Candidatus Xenobia bacterium]|nr:SRPBCC domain-containing protein [Candidatus Xenobia bacterium]